MFRMMKLSYCFVYIAALYVFRSSMAMEPVCSQYDKDKKLMEDMIETRYEVKEMAKDLRRTEEYLLSVLEYRKMELERLSQDLMDRLEKSMQNVTDRLNNLTARIENVEIPKIAFSAYNVADKGLNSNEVLRLQSVLINEGDCYNTSTGKFTAPVGGLYHFTAHVCNTFGYVIYYAIAHNGEWVARSQQFEQANDNVHKYVSCSSVTALMMMKEGDQAWVLCTSGYSVVEQFHDDNYRRNSFIGVLFHT